MKKENLSKRILLAALAAGAAHANENVIQSTFSSVQSDLKSVQYSLQEGEIKPDGAAKLIQGIRAQLNVLHQQMQKAGCVEADAQKPGKKPAGPVGGNFSFKK